MVCPVRSLVPLPAVEGLGIWLSCQGVVLLWMTFVLRFSALVCFSSLDFSCAAPHAFILIRGLGHYSKGREGFLGFDGFFFSRGEGIRCIWGVWAWGIFLECVSVFAGIWWWVVFAVLSCGLKIHPFLGQCGGLCSLGIFGMSPQTKLLLGSNHCDPSLFATRFSSFSPCPPL